MFVLRVLIISFFVIFVFIPIIAGIILGAKTKEDYIKIYKVLFS